MRSARSLHSDPAEPKEPPENKSSKKRFFLSFRLEKERAEFNQTRRPGSRYSFKPIPLPKKARVDLTTFPNIKGIMRSGVIGARVVFRFQ